MPRRRHPLLHYVACMLLTGASICQAAGQPALSVRTTAIGVLGPTDLGIGMLEVRAAMTDWLYLSLAPTWLRIEGAGNATQLRTGATLHASLGTLELEDRNQLILASTGAHQYRNRLRLVAPVALGRHRLRLLLMDEATYEQGDRRWFRNVIGAGVGISASDRVTTELYRMWQDDDHRPMVRTVVFLVSVRLQ